ncbi:unnamed protein product [Acanthocheilonema viteae]|uniref:Uncharacterized protein n=1 Tax=Acanthocheilonema viteae TaxID=6277 RepID=A0A498SMF7_ACAVI|nr:unnamed protein product [Acanthocheilonema viteae]VBB32934.1 unnamed protein product [Acanthocheilonema viteae]
MSDANVLRVGEYFQYLRCPWEMFRFPVKRMLAVWIWPLLAATLIITDWRTMKRLRATGHTTILDAMRDENTTHEII